MRKQILKEAILCDACENDVQVSYSCMGCCKKEFCCGCVLANNKHKVRVYQSNYNTAGFHDGIYCIACDDYLTETKGNYLHNLFYDLANEIKIFNEYVESKKVAIPIIEKIREIWNTRPDLFSKQYQNHGKESA